MWYLYEQSNATEVLLLTLPLLRWCATIVFVIGSAIRGWRIFVNVVNVSSPCGTRVVRIFVDVSSPCGTRVVRIFVNVSSPCGTRVVRISHLTQSKPQREIASDSHPVCGSILSRNPLVSMSNMHTPRSVLLRCLYSSNCTVLSQAQYAELTTRRFV